MADAKGDGSSNSAQVFTPAATEAMSISIRNRLYVPPYPSVPTANRIIDYSSFARLNVRGVIALTRVLVVDDHSAVRRAICHLLTEDPSLDVICQTSDGEDAVKKA